MLLMQHQAEGIMNYTDFEKLPLFHGMKLADIQRACDCFGIYEKQYNEGKIVLDEGDSVKAFGVVIAGEAKSYKTDVYGKRFTVSVIKEGQYIGLLLAGMANRGSPVTVEATDRLSVLYVPFARIMRQCDKCCSFHSKIISNLFSGLCEKTMHLHERIDCLLKPNIREKVFMFLSQYEQTDEEFEIEFDREGLAEYLNVERSALSRELSRMRSDKIIDFKRNRFKIFWE